MVKKAKSKGKNEDVEYDDEEEGEWVEAKDGDPEVTPQAVPGAALPRTTTVTTANPTPPTNVPVVYQGTPPTQPGLAPANAVPILTDAGVAAFADPLNGAVARSAVLLPTLPVTAPAAELAGKAEGSGSTTVLYWPLPGTSTAANGTDAARGVGPGVYTEKPNADHPSYGT